MVHHLAEVVVAAVVEIGRVEICVEQCGGLEQAARADVVLQMVDEGARRQVTAGAAQVRVAGERLGKERLAPAFRLARALVEPAARAELRVGQKVDLLDVGNDGVEDRRRRLRPRELVD